VRGGVTFGDLDDDSVEYISKYDTLLSPLYNTTRHLSQSLQHEREGRATRAIQRNRPVGDLNALFEAPAQLAGIPISMANFTAIGDKWGRRIKKNPEFCEIWKKNMIRSYPYIESYVDQASYNLKIRKYIRKMKKEQQARGEEPRITRDMFRNVIESLTCSEIARLGY